METLDLNRLSKEERTELSLLKQIIRDEFANYARLPSSPDDFDKFGVEYEDLLRQMGYYPEAAKYAPSMTRELLQSSDDYNQNADAWVYCIMLLSQDETNVLYVGETLNLQRRIRQHIITGGDTEELESYYKITSIQSVENLYANQGEPEAHLKKRAKNRERIIYNRYMEKRKTGDMECDIVGGR